MHLHTEFIHREKLNGTWENVVITDGETQQLIITANGLSKKTINGSSSATANYTAYSFDGIKIKAT